MDFSREIRSVLREELGSIREEMSVLREDIGSIRRDVLRSERRMIPEVEDVHHNEGHHNEDLNVGVVDDGEVLQVSLY
jgi:hypothetical protein